MIMYKVTIMEYCAFKGCIAGSAIRRPERYSEFDKARAAYEAAIAEVESKGWEGVWVELWEEGEDLFQLDSFFR